MKLKYAIFTGIGFLAGTAFETLKYEINRKDIEIKELLVETLHKRNQEIKKLKKQINSNNQILGKLKDKVEKDINDTYKDKSSLEDDFLKLSKEEQDDVLKEFVDSLKDFESKYYPPNYKMFDSYEEVEEFAKNNLSEEEMKRSLSNIEILADMVKDIV